MNMNNNCPCDMMVSSRKMSTWRAMLIVVWIYVAAIQKGSALENVQGTSAVEAQQPGSDLAPDDSDAIIQTTLVHPNNHTSSATDVGTSELPVATESTLTDNNNNNSNNNQTHTDEILVTTTLPPPPEDMDELECSDMFKYGGWGFKYNFSPDDIAKMLCRCRNICKSITLAPDVRQNVHKELYGVLSERNKTKFTAIISVYSILLLFGVVGNVTTIVGLLKWVKTTSPTFAFIISLSSSDLLLMCVCMPLKVTEYFRLADVFTERTCKLSYYLRDFTLICSVLTLTVISFERYYAICHPLVVQYRCTWIRARNIIIVTWLLSSCLALPTIFMTKYYLPAGLVTMECLQQSNEELHLHLYFIYYLGILFVLPMLIMTFTYGRSCYGLWKSTVVSKQLQGGKDRHHHSKSKLHQKPMPKDVDDSKTRRKVIKILILIVVIFLLCWGPSLVVQLLSVMDIILVSRSDIRLAVESLTYASSAINPYLFMAMSSQFRVAMLRCVRCRHRRRRDLGYMNTYKGSTISMHTVSTSGLGMTETDTV